MAEVTELANDYNEYFHKAILDELGDETLERVDWVKVEEVNISAGACRVSFMDHDAGWVKFGKAIPNVGEQVPMHQTFHGDKWVKLLTRPWAKRWTYSPAPIEATDGYPYHSSPHTAGMMAWGGRYYALSFGNGFLVCALGSDASLGLPLDPDIGGLAAQALIPPALHPRIDMLTQNASGLLLWVHGIEATIPFPPELPGGSVELGKVYLHPGATFIQDELDDASGAYVMTDIRRDPSIPNQFLIKSFNEAGVTFTDVMETPSRGDLLELNPPSIFGDGRDGAAIALAGVHYNIGTDVLSGSTANCAFAALTAWVETTSGIIFDPNPGVGIGDRVMLYIARAKVEGTESQVGKCYIGKVISTSPTLALEYDSVQGFISPPSDLDHYYAFAIRVPQFSSLEMQTNSRIYMTPIADGGPGAFAICSFDLQGSGRFDMSGAGCTGGIAGYQCGPPEGRTWEGQGIQDKPPDEIGNGVGRHGGGYGAQVEWCDPYNNTAGAGGAGGGAGHGGWSGLTGITNGVGENGAFPNGLFTYTATGDAGPRGSNVSGGHLNSTLHSCAGYLILGSGGGAGFASNENGGTHGGTDKGGDGGGCVAIFCKQGSPLIDADGARHAINWDDQIPAPASTDLHTSPITWGAGGGGGGSVYICSITAQNPTASVVGETGGIRWHDAFHDDGWGGYGAYGLIVVQCNTLLSGSFNPTYILTDLPDFVFDGMWLSAPVDSGRPGKVKKIFGNWSLDSSDNIPPKIWLLGADNAQFTEGGVRFPPSPHYWLEGDPTYPILSGVELDVTSVVNEYKRYWRLGVWLNTGVSANIADTPKVYDLLLSGVS